MSELVADQLLRVVGQLGHIFYYIVLPILLLAGIGWLLQRKLGLEMGTLRKLNFYFVIPFMMYHAIVTSPLKASDIGSVLKFAFSLQLCMGVLTYVVARLRRVATGQRNVAVMTTVLHNSGNYGLPLQELASGPAGMALQVFYMLAQNLMGFTGGVLLAAGGKHADWKKNLLHIAKFPPLYALAAGFGTVLIRNHLGDDASRVGQALSPFWDVITRIKGAFVAVALCTLGAQLGTVVRGEHRYPVTMSVVLRLMIGPLLGLGLIYLWGLEGFIAQVMLVATTTPTAVNCMLLCLEFDNHPDYAAKAVFYSTLVSPLTVTLWIFLAKNTALLPGLGG